MTPLLWIQSQPLRQRFHGIPVPLQFSRVLGRPRVTRNLHPKVQLARLTARARSTSWATLSIPDRDDAIKLVGAFVKWQIGV